MVSRYLVLIFFLFYIRFCSANQCSLLPGDLELTKGCTTRVHWKDGATPRKIRYVSIRCDGRFPSSLQHVLKYFNQFNCSSPLHLQISKPSYSLEPPIFCRVASHLYHLELTDLHPTLPGLPRSLGGLRVLKMLTLRFQNVPAGEIQLTRNLFHDLPKLEYLKVYARSVPLSISADALKPLHHLQCLLLSGAKVACDCVTLDFSRWIQNEKPSTLSGQYEDPATHRTEQCRIGTAVCGATNEPITNHGQFNCTGSTI